MGPAQSAHKHSDLEVQGTCNWAVVSCIAVQYQYSIIWSGIV